MQSSKPVIGTAVIIINKDKKILFGKRTYNPIGWSVPGGHLEYGETLVDCAKRETMEEVGIEIENVKPITLSENIFPDKNLHSVSIFCFATLKNNQEPKNMEPDKCGGWEWFNIKDLPANLSFNYSPIINGGEKLIEDYLKDIKIA